MPKSRVRIRFFKTQLYRVSELSSFARHELHFGRRAILYFHGRQKLLLKSRPMTGHILSGSVSGGDKMGDTSVGDIGFDESWPFKVGGGDSSDILNLSERDCFYSTKLVVKFNLFFCENVDS